ncbi:A/G-specific adenine glycosylase [Pedosphaera parvula]|uniref:A/G-specific adenine glycosylase n=1 Tax=Pedosphaera parvula TaxID=1032527 RepID=UPI0002FBB9E4|nr:A/G-specific adenine glycosylase [Pedosphaera parvula]
MSSKSVRRAKPNVEPKPSQKDLKIHALASALLHWFSQSARDLPWRRTRDPYAIWVSEIMLQQTQVKTVIPYWEHWMQNLPTIQSLAEAAPERIHKLWEGLGYYTRVRNMQQAAQEIMSRHDGSFPSDFDSILALKGIGRYTAGAIASIAFNQPKPLLDGNVIRVLTRLFGIAENPRDKITNEQLWSLAEALVVSASNSNNNKSHPSACSHLNQSLMELGALICTPRQPQCLICPVRQDCIAHHTGKVESLPNLGERTAATQRKFFAFVIEHQHRFLVTQRPAGVVNAHLWEFPNLEVNPDLPHPTPATQIDPLRLTLHSPTPLCTIKHTITRYRITLQVFRATLANPDTQTHLPTQWKTLAELHQLPFPSAHKKILKKLG